MNKTHAVIWNASKGCWTVASECARRRGKSGISGTRAAVVAIMAAGLTALAPQVLAGPTGGNVTHGNAVIWQNSTTRPTETVINQNSSKTVISWDSFSLNSNERVTFNQMDPSHMALNYIRSRAISEINGSITARGKVFLVNPNGIVFGLSSQVNVGSLVASTQSINPDRFFNNVNGVFEFDNNGLTPSNSPISNSGKITASDGGDIVLLGQAPTNRGQLQANGGSVALAGGSTTTLRLGNGPLNLTIDSPAVGSALASNTGSILASGGQVLLAARSAGLQAVVNNSGTIEARTLNNQRGKIVLDGGDTGSVQAGGQFNASATRSFGDGGSVELAGANVNVRLATTVDTRSNSGQTGTFTVSSQNVAVEAPSAILQPTIHTSTLANNLSTTNIELRSTAGDIAVNAPVTWTGSNTLTLNARHGGTGKLAINGALTASGNNARLNLAADERIDIADKITLTGISSRLDVDTAQPGASAPLPIANYVLAGEPGRAMITLSGVNPSFVSNGIRHTVIQNMAQLQAMGVNTHGYYVLGTDIRGSGRFNTIGGDQGVFSGSLDGLGHKLSYIQVQGAGSNIGLFGATSGIIRNLGLDGITIYNTAQQPIYGALSIGVLAGRNSGQISNVAITNSTLSGHGAVANTVGGLVGTNTGGIDRASYSGRINSGARTYAMGGLVGTNIGSSITNSRSLGTISGALQRHDQGGVGGLVGANLGGAIERSNTSASISSLGTNTNAGGAIGLNTNGGNIEQVHSTGFVNGGGQSNVGGFVGFNASGDIIDSSGSGRVSAASSNSRVGGFAGENSGTIETSLATGEVASYYAAATGGLVGLNNTGGRLIEVKANGRVLESGQAQNVGGLVGINAVGATITTGEANGHLVSATGSNTNSRIGGLVGANMGVINYGSSRVRDLRVGANAAAGGLAGYNGGHIEASGAATFVQAGANALAGGLVGQNQGTINTGVSLGSVSGSTSSTLGGLVGINHQSGKIENSQSIGTVSSAAGYATLGGLVGVNQGEVLYSVTASKIDYRNNARQTYGGLVGVNYGIMQGNMAQGLAAQIPAAGINYGQIRDY